MSERKSWDVQPKRQTRSASAPRARSVSVDGMRTVKRAPVRSPRPVARTPQTGRLRDRRNKARKTGLIVLAVVLVLLASIVTYLLWLPVLRIQTIEAAGPDAEGVKQTAAQVVSGKYLFIFPKDSIFFFPKDEVREAVLAEHPQISALSISRTSFTSIKLLGTSRVSSFIWCGTSIDMPLPDGRCYEADAEGLVFREAAISTSTVVLSTGSETPTTAGDLRIYSPLEGEVGEGESPAGHRVRMAERVPDALRFVKAIRGLGTPISALGIREDEADLWISGATRITYVLGREEEAAQLAASVIPTLTLTDGTIQYLDLRFKGKAYVKRYGE